MYELLIARGFLRYYWFPIEEHVNTKTLLELGEEWYEVRLTLKHTVTGEEKEYRGSNPLADLPDTRVTDTLADWATRWGTKQLVGFDVITDWDTPRKTYYCNAETSGYQVLAGAAHIHPTNLTDRLTQYPDIILYKDEFDAERFVKNVMVTVNGLLYPAHNQGDYISIPNAHHCVKEERHCDVGLWSFEEVSEFEYVRLNDRFDAEKDIHEGRRDITFDLGTVLGECNWYLVIRGRIFLHNTLGRWITNDLYRLKLKNADLMSMHAEDYRCLGGSDSVPVWGGDLLTRDGIRKIFEHPNTYIVKFKTKAQLYANYTALTPSGTKDKYLHMGPVDDPIMRPDNRMVGGYVTHNGDPSVPHIVSVVHSETPYLFEHTGVDTENTLLTGVKAPSNVPRSSTLFLSKVFSLEDKHRDP